MNEQDKAIRDALALDEAELLRQFDEPSLSDQVMATFRGRKRWLIVFSFMIGLLCFAFAVVSAWQFFRADSTRGMIAWACGVGLAVSATGLLKLWYFMEMNKYVVIREIKRLEFQIARISDRLDKAQ
jgi:heme/copper-type cytochrome/quinol oxidase subunit 4